MTESRQTVLIIDDHPLFRQGMAQLIELEPSFERVGEAPSAEEGVQMAESLKPDLILLDLNMKGMNGIEALLEIKSRQLESLVVVITVSNAEEDLISALRAGADGYLLKDMEPEEMLAKLQRVAKDRVVVDDALTVLLARALQADPEVSDSSKVDLTEREHEILALIADGMSNKVIARELEISDGTVKVHVKHLLRKLGLCSRLQAAAWAHKHDIKRNAQDRA